MRKDRFSQDGNGQALTHFDAWALVWSDGPRWLVDPSWYELPKRRRPFVFPTRREALRSKRQVINRVDDLKPIAVRVKVTVEVR